MAKPIVFLSHSSRDADILNSLKEQLVRRTGGSIEFFLSSDGQSIPLGSNWVHRVETALSEARLMFVFISPDSLSSPWVYFEAGFAYSKQLKVVPVGIGGIDVAHLSPPLNLLQGFNITSGASLNNLIAKCNAEFDTSHAESFAEEDYKALWHGTPASGEQGWNSLASVVSTVKLRIPMTSTSESRIQTALAANGITFQAEPRSLRMYGGNIFIDPEDSILHITLDPLFVPVFLPLLRDVGVEETETAAEVVVHVNFVPEVLGHTDGIGISARLYGTGIGFGEDASFTFEGISFRIREVARPILVPVQHRLGGVQQWAGGGEQRLHLYLYVAASAENLDQQSLARLVSLLFTQGVLYEG